MEAQSSTLTEAQQKAVVHTTGPLLVLAGPGSGKTTVVTKRITNLIDTGVAPWQILALTFTNKAAQEMRDRVQVLLDERGVQARGLTVTTFHAFCARILREWGDRVIGTTTFTI
ncbi:MAG: UvrD-helicase domain-containing protein, partial [Phycisphaerae bacterium]|nr:UvrD-helicase domain-containing protein [Phycisphaerae bacterium]